MCQHHRTLVLNADHTPLDIIPWESGIHQVLRESAHMICQHENDPIQTARGAIPRPSIILTRAWTNTYRPASLTRENLITSYARVNSHTRKPYWICALCGEQLKRQDITEDHVIPRCQGGTTSWENIVLSHPGCNNRKGSRSLRESGFSLHEVIKTPSLNYIIRKAVLINAFSGTPPDEWLSYILEN